MYVCGGAYEVYLKELLKFSLFFSFHFLFDFFSTFLNYIEKNLHDLIYISVLLFSYYTIIL